MVSGVAGRPRRQALRRRPRRCSTRRPARSRAILQQHSRRRRRQRRAGHRPAGAADQGQAGAARPLRRAGQGGARPGRVDRRQAGGRGGRRPAAVSARRAAAGRRCATSPEAIGAILMPTAAGERMPLVAAGRRSRWSKGPSTITREWGQRRITVTANVRGRDLGSFVAEAQQQIDRRSVAAAGPLLASSSAGSSSTSQRARTRLLIVVPVALRADLRAAVPDLPQRRRRAARVHRRAVRLGRRHLRAVAARHAVLDLGGDRLHRPVRRGRARRHDPGLVRPAAPAAGACRSTRR